MLRFVILTGLLLINFTGYSFNNTIDLIREDTIYFIQKNLFYFCDSTGTLTLQEIKLLDQKFTTKQLPYIEQKQDGTYYWIKFNVKKNALCPNTEWMFESWGFDQDEMTFYLNDSIKYKMGFDIPFNNRPIFHKNFLIPISLQDTLSHTYYIRIKRSMPIRLYFVMRSVNQSMLQLSWEYFLLGLFYSILTFIILLNIYLLITKKKTIHLYYLFYIACEILYCLGRDGLGFQFLWPLFPSINNLTHFYFTEFIFVISTLIYCIEFLQVKKWSKYLYIIILVTIVIKAGTLIIILFTNILSPRLVLGVDTLIMALPLIIGWISLRNGQIEARFYILAYIALFGGFALMYIDELIPNILPFDNFNWYTINAGILAEAILLSIALIDQIRQLNKKMIEEGNKKIKNFNERDKIISETNLWLEQKVSERTADLTKQMSLLENTNQELEKLNLQLEKLNAELDVDNQKITADLIDLGTLRIFLKEVKLEDFKRYFKNDDVCLKFLSEVKWPVGYACKKCGFKKYRSGHLPYNRRCKSCSYEESPSTNTIFHGIKIPLTKAFYMMYLLNSKDNDNAISTNEIAYTLDVAPKTVLYFKQKIQLKKRFKEKNSPIKIRSWEDLIL